jgi:hypothetical protein
MSRRSVEIVGEIARVPLSQGLFAIIDAADVPLVGGYTWTATVNNRATYAVRSALKDEPRHKAKIILHRVIMGNPTGLTIDHINGDGLDCRRSNLRLATVAENSRNRRISRNSSTGFKGVTLIADDRWQARIRLNGRRYNLGCFGSPEEASAAYNRASRHLHGDFGRQN